MHTLIVMLIAVAISIIAVALHRKWLREVEARRRNARRIEAARHEVRA